VRGLAIADLCIHRPVFALMINLFLVVLGWFSFRDIGIDQFPNVELPIITVTTTLRGASPEEMETSVTKPLEEIINTIQGIDELASVTTEGVSQITVQFLLERNRDIAAQDVREVVRGLNLPPGYTVAFTGRAKTLQETGSNFLIAFGLAMVFMYMILAAQFENLLHPVSILMAVPLSLPFALVTMILLREPLNIYAIFGLFMLFGIVKKNGILQVDYTNTLRAQGMERDEAILQANRVRLRPILMTTMMLVASMIPIALGQGPGAAGRASMAKVIIGGQMLCLLLSLLVTPVSYSIFDDWSHGRFRRARHKPAAGGLTG
jgi:multidrug efflux pump subunit AcrB